MCAENSDWLTRLDEYRLVAFELAQRGNDPVETVPVAGRSADSAVDDEFARSFGNIRIEVVHQHPEGRFGQPAFGTDFGSTRRSDRPLVVHSAVHDKGPFSSSVGNGLLSSREIAIVGRAPAVTNDVAAARSPAIYRSLPKAGTFSRSRAITAASAGLVV